MATKAGPSFYFLGCMTPDGTRCGWQYTALGTHPTVADAADRCLEARAIVFEQHDVIANGRAFGLSEPVAIASVVR